MEHTMPANRHKFENRLHAEAKTLADLEEFYVEWEGYYSEWGYFDNWKVEREIAHTYYELTHEIYEDGDLSTGRNGFSLENGNLLITEDGNNFILEGN